MKAVQLPSKKWRVQTYDHGVRRSYTHEDKNTALKMALEGKKEDQENARKDITVSEAMTAYIETCKAQGYSPSTIREYTSRCANSFDRIASKRLSALTIHDIQGQLDARKNANKAAKTVRNDWFLLKAVLSIYAPSLDLRKIRIAKRKKRGKLTFRESWASDVLRFARETWGEDDYYIYCLLTIFAGLRPSESYALHWSDVSIDTIIGIDGIKSGTISVSAAEVRGVSGYARKAPKTEAGERLLSVSLSLIEEIERVNPRSEGRIIASRPSLINWRWIRTRKALNLPETMRFYDLRHFYATTIANSGASEEELAARMGHSTSAFSHSVYVELFEDRKAPVNAALFAASDAAISASKTPKKQKTAHEIAHVAAGI